MVTVAIKDNQLKLKDQTQEYIDRGKDLPDMSYLDFFIDTYEGESLSNTNDNRNCKGHSQSLRSPYHPGHSQGNKCCVFWHAGHETLPEFVDPWFPRCDLVGSEDIYAAWMLFLLKPWKGVEDINNGELSLYKQFLSFKSGTSNRYQNIIKNSQYFHQCSDSAAKRRKGGDERVIVSVDKEEEETGIETDINKPPHVYTKKDLEAALQPKCTWEERLYTKIGMRIAKEVGVFNENLTMFLPKPVPKQARQEDSILLRFLPMPTIFGQTPLFLKLTLDITMTSSWHHFHYDITITSLWPHSLPMTSFLSTMTSSPEHYKYALISQ